MPGPQPASRLWMCPLDTCAWPATGLLGLRMDKVYMQIYTWGLGCVGNEGIYYIDRDSIGIIFPHSLLTTSKLESGRGLGFRVHSFL